jgi:hypothetical protein
MVWNGAWSNDSKEWTDETKEDVGFDPSEKGVFYMSEVDFLAKFRKTIICKYHDGFDHAYIKLQRIKAPQLVTIVLEEPVT